MRSATRSPSQKGMEVEPLLGGTRGCSRGLRGRRNLDTGHYGMHIRLMRLIDARLNLTPEPSFLCWLNEFHVFRVVQTDRPGMLQAGHRGDGSALISFVSTSERPTPVHAVFRAGTRSTIAKNSQRDISLLPNSPMTPHR